MQSSQNAEVCGLQALEWLVGNDELLGVFMGNAGLTEQDVRAGASDPSFLGGVLDFVLMDDSWVKEFCDSCGLNYEVPFQARQSLPGGDIPNWT